MNDKDVIEGNLLIAEFMGGKEVDWFSERVIILPYEHQAHLGLPTTMNIHNHTNWGKALILDKEVKYHSSYDWIMPVFLKAKKEIKSKQIKNYTVHTGSIAVTDAGKFILEGKCEEASKKLVEAIKWYNKTKDK